MDATILHGNCLDVMPTLPDNSIDLIVCSPPYDAIRDYKGHGPLDMVAVGHNAFRLLKDGGVACVVINDGTKDFAKSLTTFSLAVDWVREVGFKLFECVIYQRDGRPGAWWSQRFRVDHEYILIFVKGYKPKTFNKEPLKIPAKHAGATWHGTQRLTSGDTVPIKKTVQAATKCRGTVWRYGTSNQEGNKLKLRHPATFPDALARDLIQCFSAVGDVVLDPVAGSGTTVVVAGQLGRTGIGIEIAEEYIEIAEQRIRDEGQGD